MLDKILNITPGSDFNQPHYKKGKNGLFLHHIPGDSVVHDSLNYSPAWRYITQLNWRINGAKLLKDNKFYISFVISDTEFNTLLDLDDISCSSAFLYEMTRRKVFEKAEKALLIAIEKKTYNINDVTVINQLKNIGRLFERVWKLDLKQELNDKEMYLNTLLEENAEGISGELNFITVSLVSFVEKLLNRTFSHAFLQGANQVQEINIKKIKSLNP
jgi:hypothetical protein